MRNKQDLMQIIEGKCPVLCEEKGKSRKEALIERNAVCPFLLYLPPASAERKVVAEGGFQSGPLGKRGTRHSGCDGCKGSSPASNSSQPAIAGEPQDTRLRHSPKAHTVF